MVVNHSMCGEMDADWHFRHKYTTYSVALTKQGGRAEGKKVLVLLLKTNK